MSAPGRAPDSQRAAAASRSVADLRAAIERVRERLEAAARRAGRDPAQITVVAVSKTQPAAAVAAAVEAGLRHFGESRVQEAAAKIPEVARLLGSSQQQPVWRLVGHLQMNKARHAVELFATVDSVDSVRLARTLAQHLSASRPPADRAEQGGQPGVRASTLPSDASPAAKLPILLEVYVGDDPARPGFRPAELVEATAQVLEFPALRVDGLMTVAPLGWDAAATRRAFRQVCALRDLLATTYPRVDFQHLSMGMSDDFELAVEEGSTMVRIGRALFGPRGAR